MTQRIREQAEEVSVALSMMLWERSNAHLKKIGIKRKDTPPNKYKSFQEEQWRNELDKLVEVLSTLLDNEVPKQYKPYNPEGWAS